MTYVYSIAAVSVLFVLAAFLRPRSCSGRCAGCSGSDCARHEDHRAH